MTTTTFTIPGSGGDGISFGTGNDGTLTVQVGPTGAKVNAMVFDAAGHASMPQNVVAFRAYSLVAQSFANSTFTKVALATKLFDTASAFDNVTNNRFQPLVSGYYQINGQINFVGASAGYVQAAIYKNGAQYSPGSACANNTSTGGSGLVADVVYLNGSTDYVELWGWQNSGGALTLIQIGNGANYFSGSLLAKA